MFLWFGWSSFDHGVVGAVPVHAFAGVWGTLSVAIFGDLGKLGTGLDRWQQWQVQSLGVIVCGLWSFGIAYAILWTVRGVIGLRVSEDAERIGLNVPEHDASTEMIDLMLEMQRHRNQGDLFQHATVDPHTEVGQIAAEARWRSIFENAVEGIYQTTPPAAGLTSSYPTLNGRQVLLADDNQVNRFVASEMLQTMGVRVIEARNGREAVEALVKQPFDAVLMDCEMPEMDGFEASRRIRDMEQLASVDDAWRLRDVRQLRSLVHNIRGSAANVSALEVNEIATKLLRAANRSDSIEEVDQGDVHLNIPLQKSSVTQPAINREAGRSKNLALPE